MQDLFSYTRWIALCLLVVLEPFSTPSALALEVPVEDLGSRRADVRSDWLVYSQRESLHGEDLNGDGDTEDAVIHVRDLATGETTNLRLPGEASFSVSGDRARRHPSAQRTLYTTTHVGLGGRRLVLDECTAIRLNPVAILRAPELRYLLNTPLRCIPQLDKIDFGESLQRATLSSRSPLLKQGVVENRRFLNQRFQARI